MSNERPKIFANKPKKSKLKASTPITTAPPPPSKGPAAPPPPPPPKKEPFFQRFRLPLPAALERYRFLVPFVLVVNFTIGAYTLVRVTMNKKERSEEETPDHSAHFTSNPAAPTPTPTTPPAAAATITEMPVVAPIIEPIQRAPIPEDQRHELFKWMLEERRKMKPKNAEEKKRIDEEKAILKQFIGAKSLPL